ncbi:ATP-binding protein (plasmid) [Streptomyces sp. NBC_01186]|uniref:ATP-binding protein n=1 Tax=unclassified Streptomyces TaxID=2593676 RepID=UPI002DD93811|nr:MULTISPECIES: ATP-binding protein [unclassified Streptomyces]WSB81995.1 ATP-binding protein [Streptomyces sp. NBC_01775]WSS17970.1 ATP-binding protein [Streptomyces sp. NBC_01186]
MRVAIRHLVDHLMWSAAGPVWAVWRLEPQGARYMGRQQRDELLNRLTTLVRSLPRTARLYSLCAQLDAGEVVGRMLEGVDLEERPHWADIASAQLDLLDGLEMHQRTWWLTVPLDQPGRRADISAALGGVWADISALLGLRPAPVPEEEVDSFRSRAAQIEAEIASTVPMRPARPAEIIWMHQHAVHRGLEEPLLVEASASEAGGGRVLGSVLRTPSYQDLGQVRVLEGGGRDQDGDKQQPARGKKRRRATPSPVRRTWLQVESAAGTGYQAHLPLTEMPRAVAAENADLLARLEELPFPVDFVCDLKMISTEEVKEQVKRKKRELADQADQYAAHTATGLPEEMHDAADDLGELDSRASQSTVEVEVQAVTVLTVWGPDPQVCDKRAGMLSKRVRGANYRLARPAGEQEELLALSLPGTPTPPKTTQYVQNQLGEDWVLGGALVGGGFGDARGQMIGVSQDAGTVRPVLLDVALSVLENFSASLGVAGDLGAGKSVLLKLITAGLVDRGSRAIVIDRTPVREWAHFARTAAPGRSQVVDAGQARMSLDPLRVFPPATAAHYALSYLTLQLGIGPLTAQGAVLKSAINMAQASAAPSMAAVIAALEDMADEGATRGQEAAMLRDLLTMVSEEPLAAAVFDPELPPISLNADMGADWVVITTAGLTLPPREAVSNPELMRSQPTEALIGRAVLYLLAALARQVAFEDPERFCLITLDECYWLTSSAEGLALVHEVVHDGRKHGAGMALGGHNVEELGSDGIRGLLAHRFLARTADERLAARGLEFLGLPGDNETLLRTVTSDLSPAGDARRAGEMLVRDPRMRVGRMQVVVPPEPRIERGIFTTPGDLSAGPRPRTDNKEPVTAQQARGLLADTEQDPEPAGEWR